MYKYTEKRGKSQYIPKCPKIIDKKDDL